MRWLQRAKEPDLPNRGPVAGFPGGNMPGLGANANDLTWLWQMIGAGMGADGAPVPLNAEDVLSLPAVSASLSLLASYALQMPLQAVQDVEQGPPEVVTPTPTILRAPVGSPRVTGLTFADFIDGYMRDLALWGNYLAVLGDPSWDGWPRVLYPVGVGFWSVYVTGGSVVYRVGDLEYDPADVLHVKINAQSGELVGRGLLSSHRDVLAAAVMAERFAARYFQTGAVPSVHISHPNPDLTEAQATDLKSKFLASVQGSRAPVVTPIGTEITVLPNDADRAQLVEARKWNSQALAMALGVPPAMLGLEQSSMTYRNLADIHQQVINTTVMRYLVPLEQQFTAQCLPATQRARFQVAALVRPDIDQRLTQALAGFQGGLLTNAEAREWIDLPPNDELEGETDTGTGTETPAPETETSTAPRPSDLPPPVGLGMPVNAPLTVVGGSP